MNVGLVYFCYRGDEVLLGMALQAAERLRRRGDAVTVYLLDDVKAPLEVVPPGVVYKRTSFERGGNLNGLECIVGMVDEYERILRVGGHEWLVKVDCDTFLNSLDWLRGLSCREVAFSGTIHVNDHCSGACYAVSRAGVECLQTRLQEPSWRGKAARGFCEDKVIYHMSRLSGLDVLALRNEGNELDGSLYHDWLAVERVHPRELLRAYAVDFKACRWNSRPEYWEQDAITALERMKQFCDYLKEKENG